MPKKLSHYDGAGRARMVDVSGKKATRREAEASAFVAMKPAVLAALPKIPKGHPLPLARVDVEMRLCENGVAIVSKVATTAQTGVEMEAMVAATVSALTVYDMT